MSFTKHRFIYENLSKSKESYTISQKPSSNSPLCNIKRSTIKLLKAVTHLNAITKLICISWKAETITNLPIIIILNQFSLSVSDQHENPNSIKSLFCSKQILKNKAENHKNNLETWLANVNMIKVPNEQKNKLIC